MCCDGTFLDRGRIRPDEETMPLSFYRIEFERSEGDLWFSQPCAFYEGNGCPIYESRYATCRRYRCKLLRKHDSGEIGFDDARQIIANAKALLASLMAMDDRCATRRGRAGVLQALRSALADAQEDERPEIGKRIVEIVALNKFLELHFHSPKPKAAPPPEDSAS